MSFFQELSEKICKILNEFSHERRMVLFGDPDRFAVWLINNQVIDLNPVSAFDRYVTKNQNKDFCKDLFLSWQNRIKVLPKDFNRVIKTIYDLNVNHRLDLAEKYLHKFVTCEDIEKEKDFVIINENQSVLLKCGDKIVGGVIRNVAKKNVANHFGLKMKLTCDAHPKINRGQKTHADSGKLIGHGLRANFLDPSTTDSYVYKNRNLDPEIQRIYDEDGDSFGEWLYKNAEDHVPWSVLSYETFKQKVNLNNEQKIGAVFCAENYEAAGHRDKDRSEFAIGFVYEIGVVTEGYFIYPEYGVAIKMTSNSIWCWLTQAVHGTAKLNLSEGGVRYTSAITLTEKTAKAMEKEAGIMKN